MQSKWIHAQLREDVYEENEIKMKNMRYGAKEIDKSTANRCTYKQTIVICQLLRPITPPHLYNVIHTLLCVCIIIIFIYDLVQSRFTQAHSSHRTSLIKYQNMFDALAKVHSTIPFRHPVHLHLFLSLCLLFFVVCMYLFSAIFYLTLDKWPDYLCWLKKCNIFVFLYSL